MATEKRLIDANDALERLQKAEKEMKVVSIVGCKAVPMDGVIEFIETRPTVDAVEVVHGRWVLTPHEEQCNFRWNVTAECSECQYSKGEIYAGHFSGFPKHLVESLIPIYAKRVKLDNYCPNCGSKMDGDGDG